MCRKHLTALLLVTFLVVLGAEAADPPTTQAPTLIFSDRSPGSELHASAWTSAAGLHGVAPVVASDAVEFQDQLTNGTWGSVVVVARFVTAEPDFVGALRTYAAAHARTTIVLLTWHDNGVAPPAESRVLASMACVVWLNGQTYVRYTDGGQLEPETGGRFGEPLMLSGSRWPDFPAAAVEPWRIVPRNAAKKTDDAKKGSRQTVEECLAECLVRYNERVADCTADRASDEAECARLYGPGPGGMGQPEKYAECLSNVAKVYVTCVTGAVQRFERCVAICNLGT